MTKLCRGGSNHRVPVVVVAALLTCTSSTSSFPLHWNIRRAGLTVTVVGDGVRLHSSSPRSEYDSFSSGDNSNDSISSSSSSSGSGRARRKATQITDRNSNMYEVLGANPTMTRAEIKRLYISLAKETHPDASSSNSLANTDNYEDDRFNEIAQAWSILSDAKTRRAHDRELAAQDFKDDIVKKASEVAREYGPAARKFYDDFAIPLLRRTTATTIAGLSAVAEEVAASERQQQQQQQQQLGDTMSNAKKLPGVTLSEVVWEVSEMKRSNLGAGDALEDFGRAFQRVIEASKNATRQIDGLELGEKSVDLRRRADEAQMESMEVLKQLTEIRSERLRLTFHSSLAEFSSSEAIQYLNGFNNGTPSDQVTLLQRMTFKHPIKQDIEAFSVAETEFDVKVQEKKDIDQQFIARQRVMQEAENNAKMAVEVSVDCLYICRSIYSSSSHLFLHSSM
jgi:curved DNA-binding protein CbpA